ncbi:YbaB/EbfC family DNA-binding protein [Mycolicibacterium baixiangningiae]|uniref:YbaB/EbfC family DNA-binding protein n=1 Tax=Mycolicibacterium baixiangningiae TaxID=2761578 RepID=UPI001865C06A|nr:YbaB/EbfC family DNA-binding protein [Mycolicibacterium baixiangningiae]
MAPTSREPDSDWDDSVGQTTGFQPYIGAVDDDYDEASALDQLYVHTPAGIEDDDNHQLAGALLPEEPQTEETGIPLVPVTNPPGTVTVTAYLSGAVQRVDLALAVRAMTESELAEEIRVVAEVAAMKATSAMHLFVLSFLTAQGFDRVMAEDVVTHNLPFATPQQARQAEADLAARHAHRE